MSARSPRIRVAGLATRGSRLLVVQHERDGRKYYLLPGGGVEWGEGCHAALRREFAEELSLRPAVGPLLFVHESLEPGGRRHILNLTFRVRLAGGVLRVHRDRRLKGARWLERRELPRIAFYPDIRRELLSAWDRSFRDGAKWVETPWE